MPVTVKLSRNFYDRFGDELVDELVDWFNLVNATYKSELHELNAGNFVRFDKLDERVDKLDERVAKLDERVARLDAKIDQRVSDLRVEMHAGFAKLDTTIAEARADLIKWSFVFWVGAVAAIAMLAGVLDRS